MGRLESSFRLASEALRRMPVRQAFLAFDYAKYMEYVAGLVLLRDGLPHPPKKIVDIGTGYAGYFPMAVRRLLAPGAELILTDIDRDQLRTLRASIGRRDSVGGGRTCVTAMSGLAVGVRKKSVDLVTAVSTIEHIPGGGDTECIEECAPLLARGGHLYVTVPYHGAGYREDRISGDGKLWQRERGEFYQRIYDFPHLEKRIVKPARDAGLSATRMWFVEERARILRRYNRLQDGLIAVSRRSRVPLWRVVTYPFMLTTPFSAAVNFRVRTLTPELRPREEGVAVILFRNER